VEYVRGYDSIRNDPALTGWARNMIAQTFGTQAVHELSPIAPGDDFCYYDQVCPGFFLELGAASPESLEKRGRIPEKNSLPDFFARTGKSFQLNPLFVAEMMGFPPDWTVSPFLGEDRHPLKDTGTLSSPR
jgi:metal-dependent amidase/aminoacylase/carboxypeptidase family protein